VADPAREVADRARGVADGKLDAIIELSVATLAPIAAFRGKPVSDLLADAVLFYLQTLADVYHAEYARRCAKRKVGRKT
jgi:hypothetical protein